jgi:hypothetical protein
MIILNADDWGRSRDETDLARECFERGRISSATAMVFMADSDRAAAVAKELRIDIGLHVNFSEPFTARVGDERLVRAQDALVRFLASSRWASALYRPGLREAFAYSFRAQLDEFLRVYGRRPSHVDGHHHQHLCANMVLGRVIPRGERVRPSFFFWPGEKGIVNRSVRRVLNGLLARRHRTVDFFFALSESLAGDRLERIVALAGDATVEIMTHPAVPRERAFLLGEEYTRILGGAALGTYADL